MECYQHHAINYSLILTTVLHSTFEASTIAHPVATGLSASRLSYPPIPSASYSMASFEEIPSQVFESIFIDSGEEKVEVKIRRLRLRRDDVKYRSRAVGRDIHSNIL